MMSGKICLPKILNTTNHLALISAIANLRADTRNRRFAKFYLLFYQESCSNSFLSTPGTLSAPYCDYL